MRELGATEPVVRLNPRESAVGSLIVSGVTSMVWESSDLVTGWAAVDGTGGGRRVGTSGNRPLVGFDDTDVLVTLRHVRELRRAIFFGDGSRPINVQLFDGTHFTLSTQGPDVCALSVLRVGAVLELRAEPLGHGATAASSLGEFGFALTPLTLTRDDRRR